VTELQIPKLNTKKRKRDEDDEEYHPEKSENKENFENESGANVLSLTANLATETPHVQMKKLKRTHHKTEKTTVVEQNQTSSAVEASSQISEPLPPPLSIELPPIATNTNEAPTITTTERNSFKKTTSNNSSTKKKRTQKKKKRTTKEQQTSPPQTLVDSNIESHSSKQQSEPLTSEAIQDTVQFIENDTTDTTADWKAKYTSLRDTFLKLKKKYNKLREEQNNAVNETTSSLASLSSELRTQAKELTEVRAQFSSLQVKHEKLKSEFEGL
jgi:hypothetical protein